MVEWTVILGIFTGLVIFIFGIEHLSKEILLLAKQKFNEILRKSTKNRFAVKYCNNCNNSQPCKHGNHFFLSEFRHYIWGEYRDYYNCSVHLTQNYISCSFFYDWRIHIKYCRKKLPLFRKSIILLWSSFFRA